MIDIDNKIFQTIVKFVEEELPAAEQSEVEQQLKTNVTFKNHYDFYKIITGAIADYGEKELKDQLQAWHKEGILPEEKELIEVTMDHDRRRVLYHRLIWTSILALILASLFWIGYRLRQPTDKNQPIQLDAPGPVAIDDIIAEEDLFGASGDESTLMIPSTTWRIVDGAITKEATEERFINFYSTVNPNRAYQLKGDSLHLYSYDIDRLKIASLEWRKILTNGQTRQYLIIDAVPYLISPGNSPKWLGGVPADTLIRYFPDFNNQ